MKNYVHVPLHWSCIADDLIIWCSFNPAIAIYYSSTDGKADVILEIVLNDQARKVEEFILRTSSLTKPVLHPYSPGNDENVSIARCICVNSVMHTCAQQVIVWHAPVVDRTSQPGVEVVEPERLWLLARSASVGWAGRNKHLREIRADWLMYFFQRKLHWKSNTGILCRYFEGMLSSDLLPSYLWTIINEIKPGPSTVTDF